CVRCGVAPDLGPLIPPSSSWAPPGLQSPGGASPAPRARVPSTLANGRATRRRMTTTTVDDFPLPPFTNQRAVCPSCGGWGPARVNFDRDCARAAGDHYHRICGRCAHDWVESCAEEAPAA